MRMAAFALISLLAADTAGAQPVYAIATSGRPPVTTAVRLDSPTPLVELPPMQVQAYDSAAERIFATAGLTTQGLYVIDLKTKTMRHTGIDAKDRTFLFDWRRRKLYGIGLFDGKEQLAVVDPDAGTATVLFEIERPLRAAGFDTNEQWAYLTDYDGVHHRLWLVDVVTTDLLGPLILVPAPESEQMQVVVETASPNIAVIVGNQLIRYNPNNGAKSAPTTLDFSIPRPAQAAYEPSTRRIYGFRWNDWSLSTLHAFRLDNITSEDLKVGLQGDLFSFAVRDPRAATTAVRP